MTDSILGQSNLTDDQVWEDFDRMQQWAMCREAILAREQFFSETRAKQHQFYTWMCRQVPDHIIGRYWSTLCYVKAA